MQSFRRAFAAPLNISTRDIFIVAAGDTRVGSGAFASYTNASDVNADDNAFRRLQPLTAQAGAAARLLVDATASASTTPAPAAALPGSLWIQVHVRATTAAGPDAIAAGVASSPGLLPSLQSVVAGNAGEFGGSARVVLGAPVVTGARTAVPPPPAPPLLGSAAIIGIAVAAGVLALCCCVLLGVLLIRRRRHRRK